MKTGKKNEQRRSVARKSEVERKLGEKIKISSREESKHHRSIKKAKRIDILEDKFSEDNTILDV